MIEFIVTRNNELWSDGFEDEDEAMEHCVYCQRNFQGVFEVRKVICDERN